MLSEDDNRDYAGQKRIHTEEKDISIVPPIGWEVVQQEGVTLLLKAPKEDASKFRPNIQVLGFDGYEYIDEDTIYSFGKKIVENLSNSKSVQNFSLREGNLIQLADGTPGIFYYADFEANGRQIMQMHILVSSEERHFLISYSDLAANLNSFQDGEPSEAVSQTWTSLMSVTMPTRGPTRVPWGAIFFLTGCLILILSFAHRVKSRRQNKSYMDDENLDAVNSADAWDEEDDSDWKLTDNNEKK